MIIGTGNASERTMRLTANPPKVVIIWGIASEHFFQGCNLIRHVAASGRTYKRASIRYTCSRVRVLWHRMAFDVVHGGCLKQREPPMMSTSI